MVQNNPFCPVKMTGRVGSGPCTVYTHPFHGRFWYIVVIVWCSGGWSWLSPKCHASESRLLSINTDKPSSWNRESGFVPHGESFADFGVSIHLSVSFKYIGSNKVQIVIIIFSLFDAVPSSLHCFYFIRVPAKCPVLLQLNFPHFGKAKTKQPNNGLFHINCPPSKNFQTFWIKFNTGFPDLVQQKPLFSLRFFVKSTQASKIHMSRLERYVKASNKFCKWDKV